MRMLCQIMNQVNIVKKRANKSKKKNYYYAEKNENNPYDVQKRLTLPFNFFGPNAVKKTISRNDDIDKWNQKNPSTKVAVNYKSITDYYVKAMKEKPKSIAQNDDCSIFKEINRLFRNKFQSKTIPSEPERSPFCINLTKQLKGIKVENFRKSSVRRIRDLLQSDELDELSEDDDDDHKQTKRQDWSSVIVTRRSPFENVPTIPSYKFVFTTPIHQRLSLVTQIDFSGFDCNNPENNPNNDVITISPMCTINVSQNNSSILEVSSFLFEKTAVQKQADPISKCKIYFTPPKTFNFGKSLSVSLMAENFRKRITSPVTQIYKRSKVYFTPPETFFGVDFTKTPIFQCDREQNFDDYEECDFLMKPPENLFGKPFISPVLVKHYFDLD